VAGALCALTLSPAAPALAACAASARPADTPIALVLSGGGARGAYEAGVAAALAGRGVPIRLAAGSSAGALNAAMIADGRLHPAGGAWGGGPPPGGGAAGGPRAGAPPRAGVLAAHARALRGPPARMAHPAGPRPCGLPVRRGPAARADRHLTRSRAH